MARINLDRSKLLGFDVAGNLQAKVGDKVSSSPSKGERSMAEVSLDRSKLLGFDVAGNIQAKVGKKPQPAPSRG